MIRVAFVAGLTITVLAANAPLRAQNGADRDAIALTRFLPQERNKKLCFAADFDSTVVNLTERQGAPREHKLESLVAELYWDDAEPIAYDDGGYGYDRRYEVLIAARVAGREGQLFGGAQCPFKERDIVDRNTGKLLSKRTTTGLFCFQDCEGGTVTVKVGPDGSGLVLDFGSRDWLRVFGGCGDRRAVRVDPGEESRSLRMSVAPAESCTPINEHYKIDP